MIITKSDYVNFFVCPRLFVLRKFHKELGEPLDDFTKEIIERGQKIGLLAQDYFGPNHVVIDREHLDLNQCVAKTKEYINNGEHVICEASFMYKDLFCAVDVLKVNDDGSVEIYEVKCKKDEDIEPKHHADVSFQNYVLTQLGYNVKRSVILALDSKYKFKDKIDLNGCFSQIDANLQNDVAARLDEIRKYSKEGSLTAIVECKDCEFFKHCFDHLRKDGQSIYDIRQVTPHVLYNEGLRDFDDYLNSNHTIPKSKKGLGTKAKNAIQQIEFEQQNKPRFVNKPKLVGWLNKLKFPIYCLDFEAVNDTVPFINGTGPNFTRVMQFSIHIINDIHEKVHKHEEYLQSDGRKDNIKIVADELIKKLGTSGSILMYHPYERDRIRGLKALLPQQEKELQALLDRLEDLEIPFAKRYVYDKGLKGSSSIKKVLPTFCPEYENKYADLPLCHNGGQITYYYNLLCDQANPDHEKIKKGLLEYCELDTLAEVEVLKELYKMADMY